MLNTFLFINRKLFINKYLFVYIISSFLVSCSKDELPKYTELRELRILGLIANPPEVAAGGSTTITPVISDITETTSLSYEAVGCLDPGVGIGAEPTCENSASAVAIQSGTLNSGDMTAAKGFTGSAASFPVTVSATSIIFLQQSAQKQHNGISYLITYKVTNSLGIVVKSFKRIIVSTKSTKNSNPNLISILGNGSPFTITLPASQSLTLSLNLGSPAAETYSFQKSDGSTESRDEELLTTWFITDGTTRYFRTSGTETNTWDAPAGLTSGRDTFIITLTRDNRGGLSYVKNCFGTCP